MRVIPMKVDRMAPWLLAFGGVFLMLMGLYFAFIRPPLLPEDLRYIGTSAIPLQNMMPGLQSWLARVFDVVGGYIFATGLLTFHVAITGLRNRQPLPRVVIAASGLASIGSMAIVNFLIDSDYKWLLLAMTLPWLLALLPLRSLGGPAPGSAP